MLFTHKEHLSTEELIALYEDVKSRPALERIVWYEGTPAGPHSWLRLVKNAWLARVDYDDGTTVGFFWLDAFCNRSARIHFVIYDEYQADAINIGRATMGWLHELGWLYSVCGMTPVMYRHVFPFILGIGFKIIGSIPGACWLERKQKHVDAVVSVYDFGR